MALEDLPNGFVTPTRDEIRDTFQRDYRLRQPGAPQGAGSQAFIDGSVIADTMMPLYSNSISIGRGANVKDMTRPQLMDEAEAQGVARELPESAATGFVIITASAGGVYIDSARELKDDRSGLRFRCANSQTYVSGQPVPIIGRDTGPQTNLAGGTQLKWTNPPAGLAALAIVATDTNGDGLTGGRLAESDDEIRARIIATRSSPPAGGNVAQLQSTVREAGKALGIAIQEVFVYPAILGPGTMGYCFTLRPGTAGGSRVANSVQIAQVLGYVQHAFPEDDGIMACTVLESPITAIIGVTWASQGVGWADPDPWPRAVDAFEVDSVTSPTAFGVQKMGAGTATAPQVGQTIAFFDADDAEFVRKRILTVVDNTGGNYSLEIESANNASDILYAPAIAERFCPWSDSLAQLVVPMLEEFDTLGPGEQVASFFDAGVRQRRVPVNPATWPSTIRHKMLDAIDDLATIGDITWLGPAIPYTTPVGSAGVSSNLLTIVRLLVFPI